MATRERLKEILGLSVAGVSGDVLRDGFPEVVDGRLEVDRDVFRSLLVLRGELVVRGGAAVRDRVFLELRERLLAFAPAEAREELARVLELEVVVVREGSDGDADRSAYRLGGGKVYGDDDDALP